MFEIQQWMELFLQKLHATFGERVWFVGLQGSYGRGEATDKSDIDTVVVLDAVDAADVWAYHAMLDTMPSRDLICGFFSGREELLHWEPSDLFQFYHDTTPVKGSLDELLLLLDDAAVSRAVKIGACNIYHGCVHNMLHEESDEILQGLYKAAAFVVQAICFRQTGRYIRQQRELVQVVAPEERDIAETFLRLKRGEPVAFRKMSEILCNWSKKWIENT